MGWSFVLLDEAICGGDMAGRGGWRVGEFGDAESRADLLLPASSGAIGLFCARGDCVAGRAIGGSEEASGKTLAPVPSIYVQGHCYFLVVLVLACC